MPDPVTQENDGYPHARIPGPDGLDQRGGASDPLAAEAHDHVTRPNTALAAGPRGVTANDPCRAAVTISAPDPV